MKRNTRRWLNYIIINVTVISGIALFSVYRNITTALPLLTFCLMHLILKLYCPLCGMTRATEALLHGDILSSLIYNPGVIVAVAIFIYCDLRALISLIKKKDRVFYLNKTIIICYLSFLIIYFAIRNVLLIFFGIDPIGDLAVFRNK